MRTIIIDGVQGTVCAIFIKKKKGEKSLSLQSVRAGTGGFDGDHHTGSARQRQILLVSESVLNALDLEPGAVHENVVIGGLDVMSLRNGQQLQMGDALVSVTIPCEPCVQMERIRKGLQDALNNRRGMFVTVLSPGTVSVGDRVICSESAAEGLLK